MYILIDNTNDGEVVFFSSLNTKMIQDTFAVNKEDNLLVVLNRWLNKIGKTKNDILGLGVVIGKGRFTVTRVAVTVANTLALALKIPVIGVTAADYEVFMKKIVDTPVGQYVSAKYSGEAHIGGKQ